MGLRHQSGERSAIMLPRCVQNHKKNNLNLSTLFSKVFTSIAFSGTDLCSQEKLSYLTMRVKSNGQLFRFSTIDSAGKA